MAQEGGGQARRRSPGSREPRRHRTSRRLARFDGWVYLLDRSSVGPGGPLEVPALRPGSVPAARGRPAPKPFAWRSSATVPAPPADQRRPRRLRLPRERLCASASRDLIGRTPRLEHRREKGERTEHSGRPSAEQRGRLVGLIPAGGAQRSVPGHRFGRSPPERGTIAQPAEEAHACRACCAFHAGHGGRSRARDRPGPLTGLRNEPVALAVALFRGRGTSSGGGRKRRHTCSFGGTDPGPASIAPPPSRLGRSRHRAPVRRPLPGRRPSSLPTPARPPAAFRSVPACGSTRRRSRGRPLNLIEERPGVAAPAKIEWLRPC